jgi:hypothetical protein
MYVIEFRNKIYNVLNDLRNNYKLFVLINFKNQISNLNDLKNYISKLFLISLVP